jgi:hypothetical protein
VKKSRKIALDFEIDKLTNSIQNTFSGDSFPTDVSRLTKTDLKQVAKKMDGLLIGKLNSMTIQKRFIS